jgi:hypothetical protein
MLTKSSLYRPIKQPNQQPCFRIAPIVALSRVASTFWTIVVYRSKAQNVLIVRKTSNPIAIRFYCTLYIKMEITQGPMRFSNSTKFNPFIPTRQHSLLVKAPLSFNSTANMHASLFSIYFVFLTSFSAVIAAPCAPAGIFLDKYEEWQREILILHSYSCT